MRFLLGNNILTVLAVDKLFKTMGVSKVYEFSSAVCNISFIFVGVKLLV